MKYAIIGSRSFNDYDHLKEVCKTRDITEIISGGALGADTLARKYAEENNIPIKEYKPDYDTHGKNAPHIRNNDIVNDSDAVIAFWDGKSKGTKSVFRKAEMQGKPLYINYSKDIDHFSRKTVYNEPFYSKNVKDMYISSDIKSSAFGKYLKNEKIECNKMDKMERYKRYKDIVHKYYNKESFEALKGKDNVFIAMPSTNNKNYLPHILAKNLQKDFGGEVISNNHLYASDIDNINRKDLNGLERIKHNREYNVNKDVLNPETLKGKNLVVVDDVCTTGSSFDSARLALQKEGLNVNYTANLFQAEKRLATPRDFARITEKTYKYHPDKDISDKSKYFDTLKKLYQCFDGALKHKVNYLERALGSNSNPNISNRKEFHNVLETERRRIEKEGRSIRSMLPERAGFPTMAQGRKITGNEISREDYSSRNRRSRSRVRDMILPVKQKEKTVIKEMEMDI